MLYVTNVLISNFLRTMADFLNIEGAWNPVTRTYERAVKVNTSTSIIVTKCVTSLQKAFTGEQIEARLRLLNPPKVADMDVNISYFPADVPFELNGRIDRVQFEDIVARLNFFNLRSYMEVNLQFTNPQCTNSCFFLLYHCCCLVPLLYNCRALETEMRTVQNQIRADAKIAANSIDAELNARDANLHFRLAPDFTWIEFYCQNGWSAPSNNAIVVAPGYQDVPPRMEQAPGIVIPLLSSCHDCQHISFFFIILTSDYIRLPRVYRWKPGPRVQQQPGPRVQQQPGPRVQHWQELILRTPESQP